MSNKINQVGPNRSTNPDDPNPTQPDGGLPEGQVVMYLIALVMVAVATILIGYLVGTTIEGRNGEKDLEANQQQATQAIQTRQGIETEAAVDAAAALNNSQRQGTAQVATLNAQATAALDNVTQQFEATRDTNDTATAIVAAYTDTPVPTPTFTPEVPQAQLLSVLTEVRLGPDTDYPVIGSLSQDTMVDVIGPSADGLWYQIEYTDEDDELMTGFVRADSIRITAGSIAGVEVAADFPTLTPTPSPTSTMTYTPTAFPSSTPSLSPTPINPEASVLSIVTTVRSGPSEDYPVVDILNQDAAVTIMRTSQDGLWFEVRYGDGDIGYVRADALRLTGGSLSGLVVAVVPSPTPLLQATFAPTPTAPQAAAAGQFLVVREGPAEVFSTIGVVGADEPLEIIAISTDGFWFQVEFNTGSNGQGWISGQLIHVAGDLNGLPVVQGPPLPNTGVVGGGASGSGSSTSAGSQSPVDPTDLPISRNNNYNDLDDLNAYAYQFAVAVDGEGDGQPYQLFLTMDYAQSLNPDQAILSVDAIGDVESFLGGTDTEFLEEFLPLIVGRSGNISYFYSEADGFCFDVGNDLDLVTFRDDFQTTTTQNSIDLINSFPPSTVYGIVDQNGLVGISGNHYQLLGLQQGDDFAPLEGVKADFWWTDDESVLYGFRVELSLNADNLSDYIDVVTILGIGVENFSTFEGTVTIYVLPRAIDDVAVDMTTPPAECDTILP